MVGLYHKRRAERSSSHKLWRWVTRLSIFCGGLIILGFAVMILFFNGSQVKGPLSAYLSNKSDMDVAIEDAEFSPLYPNIIKLYGVTFGQSSIGELYIEYDLRSAVGNDELQIKDLYLNKINIEPDDLVSLATTKLGFKSIKVQTVRFHGTPLRTAFLNSPSSTVRLENVTFSTQEGLTFKSGSLSTGCARLFGDEVKSFNIDFEHSNQGIAIKNFSTAILGGTVTGRGFYNLKSLNNEIAKINEPLKDQHENSPHPLIAEIILDELNLSNVIINEGIRAPKNVSLSSKKTNLHDVIFTNDSLGLVSTLPEEKNVFKAPIEHKTTLEDKFQEQYLSYIMQGINGSIDDLTIDQDSLHGIFQGKIDEISFPNLHTTFENNNTEASFANNKLEFSLKGHLFEGTYSTAGNFDFNQHHLNITELKLNKNKLALTNPRLAFLKEQFAENSLFIKKAHFFQLEFLSFINSLPLSVQAISGDAANIWVHPKKDFKADTDRLYEILSYITFDHEAKETANENSLKLDKNKFIINPDIYVRQFNKRQFLKENDHSTLNLKLINMLYSNLLMKETDLKLTLSEHGLAINLDKVIFKESSVSALGFLSLKKNNKSKLTIKAHDFESADLNSNLIGHMLTGKINLDVDIESTPQQPCFKNLLANATGSVTLNSEALLIADFGLDLINGGKKANYELTTTELLSAIQGSVAGINNLDIKTTLDQGQAKASGTAALVTSLLSFDSTLDLKEDQVSGQAFLISRAKDSSTQVTISGNSFDPIFNIKALKRGEKRPGLYLPQYEASAQAKERTDAAIVLKGLIAPLLAPAKKVSSDQSAILETTIAPAPAKDEATNDKRQDTETTKDKADAANTDNSQDAEATTDKEDADKTDKSQAVSATNDAPTDKSSDAKATKDKAAVANTDNKQAVSANNDNKQDAEATTAKEDTANTDNSQTASATNDAPTDKSSDTEASQTVTNTTAKADADKTDNSQAVSATNNAPTDKSSDTEASQSVTNTAKEDAANTDKSQAVSANNDKRQDTEATKDKADEANTDNSQAVSATNYAPTDKSSDAEATKDKEDTANTDNSQAVSATNDASTDKSSGTEDSQAVTTTANADEANTDKSQAASATNDASTDKSSGTEATKDKEDEANTDKSQAVSANNNAPTDKSSGTEATKDKEDAANTDKSQAVSANNNAPTDKSSGTEATKDKEDTANTDKSQAVSATTNDEAPADPNKIDGANSHDSGEAAHLQHDDEMLQRQADEMERALFKDALIDSIINGYGNDEEELLF